MTSRSRIIAGQAVIVVSIQDQLDKGLMGIRNKMNQISYSIKRIGEQAMRGGFFGGVAVAGAVRQYTKFDDVMRDLAAKYEIVGFKTKEQISLLKSLEDQIISISKNTRKFRPADVGGAAVSLAAAGFSPEELKGSLKGIIDLSTGTNYALDETADMMANVIRTFNLFSKDESFEKKMATVDTLASQFVKATNLGTISIQDLRESLKYASGSAKDLGVQLPIILGFLVQASESGLKASLGGTSFNTALRNMIKNSKKLKEVMPDFEIITDSMGNEDVVGTLAKIYTYSQKLSKVKQVELFGDIFNIRGARFISSVQELDRVQDFIKQIATVNPNLAGLQSKELAGGVGGGLNRILVALDELSIKLGRLLDNELKAFFNAIGDIINRTGDWIVSNKLLAASLVASPAILGAVGVGAFGLSFGLARVAQLSKVASSAVKILGTQSLNSLRALDKLAKPLYVLQKMNRRRIKKGIPLPGSSLPGMLGGALGSIDRGIGRTSVAIGQYRIERAIGAEKLKQLKLDQLLDDLTTRRAIDAAGAQKAMNKLRVVEQELLRRKYVLTTGTMSREAEALKQLAKNSKLLAIQEKTYDKLYAIRKRIAMLEAGKEIIPTSAAARRVAPLGIEAARAREVKRVAQLTALRAREARMVQIVNKADIGPVAQKVLANSRLKTSEKILTVNRQLASVDARRAKLTKMATDEVLGLRGAGIARAASRGTAAAGISGGLPSLVNLFTNLAKGGGLRVLATVKQLFSGANFAAAGKNFLTIGKSLFTLGRGLLSFSWAATRFVFSWNAVGLAFNGLLLFGDKIPFVVNSFNALGRGLNGFVGALSRIGTYAKPAIDLIKTSIGAFSAGNSDVGWTALGDALKGIGYVIYDQVIAGWNYFLSQIEVGIQLVKEIGKDLMIIFDSITTNVGAIFGGIGSDISKLFGLSGGGNDPLNIVHSIIYGADYFATVLTKSWFEFKGILYDTMHAILPKTEAGEWAKLGHDLEIANTIKGLNVALAERKAKLESLLTNPNYAGIGANAEGKSQEWQKWMEARAAALQNMLDAFNGKLLAQDQAAKGAGAAPVPVEVKKDSAGGIGKPQWMKQWIEDFRKYDGPRVDGLPSLEDIRKKELYDLESHRLARIAWDKATTPRTPGVGEVQRLATMVSAIVGSVIQTRGALYGIEKSKDTEILKKIEENTRGITPAIETGSTF